MQKTKIFRESQVLKSSHLNTTGFSRCFFTQQEAGAKIEKQQEQTKYTITNVKNPWIT